MTKWFERLKSENNNTKETILESHPMSSLDVISKSTQGVLDEDESTEITRVSDLIDRLFFGCHR